MNKNQKYVTSDSALKGLEGQLLGLIDILSLGDDQRDATKAAVRQYVWGMGKVFLTEEKFKDIERMEITYSPAEDIKSRQELGWE